MGKTTSVNKYLEWVKYLETQGTPLTVYLCPGCQQDIKTMTAPEGEVWDSFTVCPWCKCGYFKIVAEDKVATQLIINQKKDN